MEELRRGACSRCSCGRAPGLCAGLCGREGEGGIVSDDVDGRGIRRGERCCAHSFGIGEKSIALLGRIELEGEKFDETQVWAPAWARLERKVLALKYKVGEVVRRAESRGDQVPDMRKRSVCVAPLASFGIGGEFRWNDELVKKIKSFTIKEPRNRRRPTGGR